MFRALATTGEEPMAYVILEPCIDVNDRSCADVCPVDCIYEGEAMSYIHPDECIDCGVCESACPVIAILPEDKVPEAWQHFIGLNRDFDHASARS